MKKESKKDILSLKLVEVNYGDEEKEILKEEIEISDAGDFKARFDLEKLKISNPRRCFVKLDGEEFPTDQFNKRGSWICRAGEIADCFGAVIDSKNFKGEVWFDGFPNYKDRLNKPYFKLVVEIWKQEEEHEKPVMEKKEVLANAQL